MLLFERRGLKGGKDSGYSFSWWLLTDWPLCRKCLRLWRTEDGTSSNLCECEGMTKGKCWRTRSRQSLMKRRNSKRLVWWTGWVFFYNEWSSVEEQYSISPCNEKSLFVWEISGTIQSFQFSGTRKLSIGRAIDGSSTEVDGVELG